MAAAADAELCSGYQAHSFPRRRWWGRAQPRGTEACGVKGGGVEPRGRRQEAGTGGRAGFGRARALGLAGRGREALEKASSGVGWTGEG